MKANIFVILTWMTIACVPSAWSSDHWTSIYSNTQAARLVDVNLNKESTVVAIEVKMAPLEEFTIRSTMYLSDESGARHPVQECMEASLDSPIYLPLSGRSTYHLVFPAMPREVAVFDIVEGDARSDWAWYGIHERNADPICLQGVDSGKRMAADSLHVRPLSPKAYYGLERERIYSSISDKVLAQVLQLCDYWAWKHGMSDAERIDLRCRESMNILCERVFLLTANDSRLQQRAFELEQKTGEPFDITTNDLERYAFLRSLPLDGDGLLQDTQLLRSMSHRLWSFSNMSVQSVAGGPVRFPEDDIVHDSRMVASMNRLLQRSDTCLLVQQMVVEHIYDVAANRVLPDIELLEYYASAKSYLTHPLMLQSAEECIRRRTSFEAMR